MMNKLENNITNHQEESNLNTSEKEIRNIRFLNTISNDKITEIIETQEKLDEFIEEHMTESFNFNDTTNPCYALSTLFCLATDWKLVQGYKIKEDGSKYYHSWVEKDDVVYDPAIQTATTKEIYEQAFTKEDEFDKEEVKEYFRLSGTFTYFKKGKKTIIEPENFKMKYETQRAFQQTEDLIITLTGFLLNMPNVNLNNGVYVFDDFDVTRDIKSKALMVAYAIQEKEGGSLEEAYIKYINSEPFRILEDTHSGLWVKPYPFVINHYFEIETNKIKEKVKDVVK